MDDKVNAKALNCPLKDAVFLNSTFVLGAAAALHCLILKGNCVKDYFNSGLFWLFSTIL